MIATRSTAATLPPPMRCVARSKSAQFRRRAVLVLLIGVGTVFRTHERQDLPELVARLDQCAERRHRADHVLAAVAAVARFLQLVGAERDEAEQRVVVTLIDPHVVGQRRTHAAAATTAVATVAAVAEENLLALRDD